MPRAALAAALALLWLVGPLASPDGSAALGVDGSTSAGDLARGLADAMESDARIVYADSLPPTAAVSALLAGEAGHRGVTLLVPGSTPAVEVRAPAELVAERRAALEVVVRGAPSSDAVVVVTDASGLEDTVRVGLDASGVARASVGVEPHRAGAAAWTATYDGASATTRAWVRPPAVVRVLVLTGPPGHESRQLVRALEAAGIDVEVRQDLGRGLIVESDGARMPMNLEDLDLFDVVAVVEPLEEPSDLLDRWVHERGGGLLRIRTPGVEASTVSGLTWAGPAEILPLPAAELRVRAEALEGSPGGAGLPVAVGDDGDAITAARADWLGLGRVYTSGLESWPWVMEIGAGAAHRRHWESVVEWLAGGLAPDATLRSDPAVAGLVWTGRMEGTAPDVLELRRPEAAPAPGTVVDPELLPTPALAALPLEPGAYTLSGVGPATFGERPLFGFVAGPADESYGWADAALRIGGAGGTVVVSSDATGEPLRPLGDGQAVRWLLFVALASLAGAGWALRRIRGLA